jgi:hypothetical protein
VRHRFVPFAFALLAMACGGDDGEASPPSTDEASTTTTTAAQEEPTTTTAPGAAEVTVEVLDAGTEPREALRYALEDGAEFAYEQVIVLEQSVGGTSLTLTTTSAVVARVEAVADGVADVAVEFGAGAVEGGPGVPPEAVTAAQSALDVLAGTTVAVELDDRGRILSSELDVGAGDPAIRSLLGQLGSTLSQLTIALPDEPIGAGARWRVQQQTDVGGVVSDSSTTYTLTGVDGGVATLDFAGQVDLSGAASGRSTGAGTSRLDLGAPLAESEGVADSAIQAQGATIDQRLENRFTRR